MDSSTDISQLCRLCLLKDKVNTPIFEGQGDIGHVYKKISSLLPVKVAEDDKLPKSICDSCTLKLDMFYEFWQMSGQSEKKLLEWLNETEPNNINQPTETIVKQEAIDINDKLEVFMNVPTYGQDFFEETTTTVDEPQAKRPKRATAAKASATLHETDDEDDPSETLTKMEDESEGTEGEDQESAIVNVPSTSADSQPGPSGVGKESSEAPWLEENKHSCAICSEEFQTKEKFLEHHMNLFGQMFTCCRCFVSFKTCTQLYQHYESHDIESNDEQEGEKSEEVVLFENPEIEYRQPTINDPNELLYILDDSHCVNEVVIDEDQEPIEQETEAVEKQNDSIVSLEHGYVIPNVLEETVVEDIVEGEEEYDLTKQFANKASTSKMFNNAKFRTPQPKKRHEVPDFTASNYIFVNANEDIDVPHYKCLRCEQLFINKFVFFRHIEKGKCYINNCDVCSATFNKNSEFFDHYVAEHTDRAICNFCFRTFMYEKNVKEHMLRHLDQFRHRCEDCNKGFYTVREYRNHYKNRHMGIRHKCEVCGRSFADEYYFKRHIATHAKAHNITVLQVLEKST